MIAGLLTLGTSAFAASPVRWASDVDGNWHDASRWSPAVAPTNVNYDALITASGEPYTITLSNAVEVNAVTVGGSGSLVIDSASLVMHQGLTLQDSTVRLAGPSGSALQLVARYGSPTAPLAGTGQIIFDGGTAASPSLLNFAELPTGITVRTGLGSGQVDVNGATNNGTISAATQGQTITLAGGSYGFVNNGLIEAKDGGTIVAKLDAGSFGSSLPFVSNGTVALSNGGTILFTGNAGNPGTKLPVFKTFTATDSTIRIATFSPALRMTIPYNSNDVYLLQGGSILQNVLSLDGPGTTLHLAGGMLYGSTGKVSLTTTNGARVVAEGSATSSLRDLVLNNVSISMESASINIRGNSLFTHTPMSGTGELVFNGSDSSNQISYSWDAAITSGLTIRSGAAGGTIDAGPWSLTLEGAISARTPGMDILVKANNFHLGGLLEAKAGATLHVSATTAVNHAGTIHAGAGSSVFLSRLASTSAARTLIDIESANSSGKVAITGATSLDGELLFSPAEGYWPDLGDSWTFLTSDGGISGGFSSVSSTNPHLDFSVSYTASAATATVRLVGDANADGVVGFPDFVALANHFGQPGDWADGNFDGSAAVDFADFILLANHFGMQLGGTNLAVSAEEYVAFEAAALQHFGVAVPEPGSLALLAAGAGSALLRRRRAK